jgi:hypothetical protein
MKELKLKDSMYIINNNNNNISDLIQLLLLLLLEFGILLDKIDLELLQLHIIEEHKEV